MSAGVGVNGRDPVFIVGTGRCGTTLLQAIVTTHSEMAGPPETHFFMRFDPAVRFSDPLRDVDVEGYIARVTGEPYFASLGMDAGRFAAAVRDGARSARSILLWMLSELTGVTHPEAASDARRVRYAEKTPGHQKYLKRVLAAFPGAQVVHIHRDPRDTVASLRDASFVDRSTVCDYARYYRRVMERQFVWAERLGPKRHLTVRYESLVADLEREVRRVCGFLGLGFDARMLEHHRQERERPVYLGFERGWKEMVEGAVNRSRVGRYRSKLTPREVVAVERTVGGTVMERCEYSADADVDRRWWWGPADGGLEAWLRLNRFTKRTLGLPARG